MSIVAPPLALGTVGILLLVAGISLFGAVAYVLYARDNPRQAAIDTERERVSEEIPLGNVVDYQSEFKPPREP